MSPLKFSENSPEEASLGKGQASWYCFKIFKFILILLCLMTLFINQQFHSIEDNFSSALKGNDTETKLSNAVPGNGSINKSTSSFSKKEPNILKRDSALGNLDSEQPAILRVERKPENTTWASQNHHASEFKLSDFLIMYPCCTTVSIILGMEIIGQALKDPLNKCTNLILILLCILLSLAVFVISLVAALRNVQATMIILSVLSLLFFLLEFTDLILLLLS